MLQIGIFAAFIKDSRAFAQNQCDEYNALVNNYFYSTAITEKIQSIEKERPDNKYSISMQYSFNQDAIRAHNSRVENYNNKYGAIINEINGISMKYDQLEPSETVFFQFFDEMRKSKYFSPEALGVTLINEPCPILRNIFILGEIFAFAFLSVFIDRFGRKKMFTILSILFTISSVFALTNYYIEIGIFCSSFFGTGCVLALLMLAVENSSYNGQICALIAMHFTYYKVGAYVVKFMFILTANPWILGGILIATSLIHIVTIM